MFACVGWGLMRPEQQSRQLACDPTAAPPVQPATFVLSLKLCLTAFVTIKLGSYCGCHAWVQSVFKGSMFAPTPGPFYTHKGTDLGCHACWEIQPISVALLIQQASQGLGLKRGPAQKKRIPHMAVTGMQHTY